jgi:enoyl-CoA hydratase/carnithine racemase
VGQVHGDARLLTVDLAIEDGVATVVLDRPEKRNALSIGMRRDLAASLNHVGRRDDVRATVVTGRGSAFCAGMDTTQFGGDQADRDELLASTDAFLDALLEHPHPLIAAVNGPAVGGGFVLALLCDLRIAAESARFGFPELARGIPASYGAARLALSRAVAAELSLTGRILDAPEALRLGVVSAVVPDGDLPAAAADRARWIARLPRSGVATTLGWVRSDRAGPRVLLREERETLRNALSRGP